MMNRKIFSVSLSGLVMLMTILACAMPGQTAQPTPGTNPNAIETFIAGTAQVITEQTVQASLNTATSTLVPTETLITTPKISSAGTSLVIQEDQTTLFTDHKARIQLTFPTGWLALRVGEPDYYMAAEKVGTQNAWFLEEIGSLQTLDLNVFRVHAYDLHPEHVLNNALPKINVVFLQDDKRTLRQIEADERTLIKRSIRSGHKHLSSDFQVLSGLEVLIFQSQWDAISYPTTHYKGTFFKVPAGTVVIDFFIASEQQDALELEWKQIVESIALFTP